METASSYSSKATAALLLLVPLAFTLRLPLLGQSLWYDEMYTLLHFVAGPWGAVVSGEYSPNNHVLFTLLAKIAVTLLGVSEWSLRLPSAIAGACAGLALAWPLRREHPALAVLLAIFCTAHPWLIAFSVEARGYALMLFLCILATHLLPDEEQILSFPYIGCLIAAIYTIPIALLIVPAHLIAVAAGRRAVLPTFIRSAALAIAMAALLYVPFFQGIVAYYSEPHRASLGYPQFLIRAVEHTFLGMGFGARWPLLLLPLLIGGVLRALHMPALRTLTITFLAASIFALLLPLLIPSAAETRFVPWLIPLYVIAATALLSLASLVALVKSLWRGLLHTAAIPLIGHYLAALLLLAILPILAAPLLALALPFTLMLDRPAQPIRDAVESARRLGADPLIGAYTASVEARAIYAPDLLHTYSLALLRLVEARGDRPVVVVFYPDILARQRPDMLSHLNTHYSLIKRLEGRVSPADVYRRKVQ